mgnify:CR=1 FL=1|jgi:hypothetical protein
MNNPASKALKSTIDNGIDRSSDVNERSVSAHAKP